ncbi:MAG TPA: ABC transporter substrate-binding protein [Candidatus Binatia bacterium]|nr:ABC transporter substrate-binding protein [Candidatus Binatia bacterium]
MQGKFFARLSRTTLLLIAVTAKIGSLSWAESTVPQIGVLTPGLTFDPVFRGLQEGLARLGYTEGKNISFIVENTKGNTSDLGNRAVRLAESKPKALFTVSTSHTAAAMKATPSVPIVFAWVGDPLQSGFVASYVSSKNNLTGVSSYAGPLSGKRLEMLKEIEPKVKQILAIVAAKDSVAENSFEFLDETARKIGVHVLRRDVTSKEEIENVLRATPKGSIDAIYHIPSALVGVYIDLLIRKAKENKIPLVVHEESMVEKGALFTYGADFRLVGIQAARLVAKVLKGERPAEIPTETPEKLLFVLNLSTAKAINFKVPRDILERADRLIQ